MKSRDKADGLFLTDHLEQARGYARSRRDKLQRLFRKRQRPVVLTFAVDVGDCEDITRAVHEGRKINVDTGQYEYDNFHPDTGKYNDYKQGVYFVADGKKEFFFSREAMGKLVREEALSLKRLILIDKRDKRTRDE